MEDRRKLVPLDALAFLLLYGHLAAAFFILPESPLRHLREPTYTAALGDLGFVLFITALRLKGPRGSRLERIAFALFLASMPLVYVSTWFRAPNHDSTQLWVELAGVAVFGVIAVLGVIRSPWLLPIGILAHGVLWDLWHHGRSTFMPDWYAVGCLVADVAMAGYSAIQVPAWRRSRSCALETGGGGGGESERSR